MDGGAPPTEVVDVRRGFFEYLCLCGLRFRALVGEVCWGGRDVTREEEAVMRGFE